MIQGLVSAAAGMMVRIEQQDMISDNLANVNTVGYRRKTACISSFESKLQNAGKSKTSVSCVIPQIQIFSDNQMGPSLDTGSPINLELDGPGYFVAQTPNGTERVRGGNFKLDAAGQLVTIDGHPVLGKNGVIKVGEKDLNIDSDGAVYSGNTHIDTLRIDGVSSTNPAKVLSGKLEGSNVNTVEEMVSMITALRSYEACQKSIQAIDQTLDKVINGMAK